MDAALSNLAEAVELYLDAKPAAAAATPPAFTLLINATNYGTAFAVAVLFPLAAGLVIPVAGERLAAVASSGRG